MRRPRSHNLRGSVRQSTVRVPARERSLYGALLRLGALAGAVLIVLGFAIYLWQVDWPQREAARIANAALNFTRDAHFAVKDVLVEGRQQTSKDDIYAALGPGAAQGAPILGFDPAAAQARLTKLPWVATAIIERRLPDTILVWLTERVPLARWQHDNRTVVIDAEGKKLPNARPEDFANLPLAVGADAPAETSALLGALKNYPSVQNVMTAAVRVGGRRWDLHLEPGVTAKLPEKDIDGALQRLSQLIVDKKILDRNVVAIDLRLPDRLVIEPAGGAHNQGDAKL